MSKAQRIAALQRVTQGGPVDVGTGVDFTEELFDELIAALPGIVTTG
jgi:hypothetical protein